VTRQSAQRANHLRLSAALGGSRGMLAKGCASRSSGERGEQGATAVEYAIMLAGVALLVVATAFAIGPPLAAWFNQVIVGLGG